MLRHPASGTAGIPRRTILKAGAAAGALVAAPFVRTASAQDKTLYVNTWGGVWEQSAKKHIFDPFTRDTGVEIRTVSPVSFAKLAAQTRSGVYEFDVTTLGAAEILRANDAKLIEPIEGAPIDASKLWKGAVFLNGVGFDCFATVIAYRADRFPNGGPQTWADFWNVERFPGTRSLQRYAGRILPLALLADGVPVDRLYPLDLPRAFAALNRIKPHVRVWWTQGQQSQQLLRDGEVDMIGIWQGRVFELIDQGHPIRMTWNQAEIDKGYWVVAKGTPRRDVAWKFVESACDPERQANFARDALTSPVNPKAFAFIGGKDAERMATAPANYPQAFEQDILNFGGDLQDQTRRFEQWIAS